MLQLIVPPDSNKSMCSQFGHSTLNTSNYGGQQSSVKLSTKSPQLQLVKRVPGQSANIATVPRTQTFSAPKPVIKFTPGGTLTLSLYLY